VKASDQRSRPLSEFGKGGCGGPKPPRVPNQRAGLIKDGPAPPERLETVLKWIPAEGVILQTNLLQCRCAACLAPEAGFPEDFVMSASPPKADID